MLAFTLLTTILAAGVALAQDYTINTPVSRVSLRAACWEKGNMVLNTVFLPLSLTHLISISLSLSNVSRRDLTRPYRQRLSNVVSPSASQPRFRPTLTRRRTCQHQLVGW